MIIILSIIIDSIDHDGLILSPWHGARFVLEFSIDVWSNKTLDYIDLNAIIPHTHYSPPSPEGLDGEESVSSCRHIENSKLHLFTQLIL